MTIVINTKTYTADAATSANSIPYLGPLQTLSVKDRLDISRVPPKANGVYSGNARARVKLTRTCVLTGAKTISADALIDTNMSIPVGTSSTDVDVMIADHAAGLAQQWAKNLAKNQTIVI